MRCLMEYILMCPEIGGPGSGVPVNFRDMMETGKFEVLCESYMSGTCSITKAYPCHIHRFFSAVKIENFIGKFLIFFSFLLKT